jgi:hypothetical protein
MFNRFSISFDFEGRQYNGEVKPLLAGVKNRKPTIFQVFMNRLYYGQVNMTETGWETNSPKCAFMLNKIGNQIMNWYYE